ncbi:NUDIX domain-containing protein [Allosaccharopolyspora coralli]|uniref:NUDIX domain-containing protein n=1 Tax=Allosaccharopolyspora coralli TaxID=2665642 RepID=A0A5Q3Q4Y5_9PSEU|nr:NUDIX domain-containing protein [Allosaccharopolyspora coralli]QGK68890.1 NUDIX domain-containing protein [Allosaccharopolyspora coralli]
MIVSDRNPLPCVGAVVHDDQGRLLLVRRANEPRRGLWSLPGGRVESGESDRSAVAREVLEETGLSVTVGPIVGRTTVHSGSVTYGITDYSCWSSGETPCAGDDAAAAMWVGSATFATLDAADALTEGLAALLRSWNCLPTAE